MPTNALRGLEIDADRTDDIDDHQDRLGTLQAQPRTVDAPNHFDDAGRMEENHALAALTALAHPQRLRVYRQLVGAGPDGMTPGDLCAVLGLPASTLSFHLRGLLDGALVEQERQGRQLRYRPRLRQMQALLDYLSAHCCAGAGCAELPIRGAVCAPEKQVAGPERGCAPDNQVADPGRSGAPETCPDPVVSKESIRCTS